MRIFVGALFILVGVYCVTYVWAGAAALEREPPFASLGVLLIGIGLGVWGRSRAAGLLARAGLGATLLVILWTATGYVVPGTAAPESVDDLVRRFHLLSLAIAAAMVVILLLLVKRVRHASAFGAVDLLPLSGLAAGLTLAVVWL